MSFMEEYYQQDLEPSEPNIISQLSIYIDGNSKQLMFACDWQDTDGGVLCISEILSQLNGCALFDKILENLLQQCVLQNRLDDFNRIKARIDNSRLKASANELVIRPRDAR